jgi:hypothetical protein
MYILGISQVLILLLAQEELAALREHSLRRQRQQLLPRRLVMRELLAEQQVRAHCIQQPAAQVVGWEHL